MIVSTARAIDRQIPLWHGALDRVETCTPSRARNICGEFFEEATAGLTGAVRLKTDSTADICPDMRWGEGIYFESKSVGKSGQAIIYSHRMRKDISFLESNDAELFYFIWHHGYEVIKAETRKALCEALANEPLELIVAPIALVKLCCETRQEKVLNTMKKTPDGKRLGFGSNGYGIGWKFPIKELANLCHYELSTCYPFRVGGSNISRIRVKMALYSSVRFLKAIQ